MSTCETAARPVIEPMITGRRRVGLRAADQETIAFWLCKTAMTLQLARPDLRPDLIPQRHYSELYAKQRPPITSQIWIGACAHDNRPPDLPAPLMTRYRLTPVRRFRPRDVSEDQPLRTAYSVAISLGNLAGLIFGHQYDASRSRLQFSGSIGAALIQIWPPLAENAEWPQDHALSYREFDGLTQSFAKYS
jgi:hypothetical protein